MLYTEGGMGKRILLFEDDPLTRLCIVSTATDRGLSVTSVPNGCFVLYELKKAAYDVVLTDIQMPKVSGLKVIQIVRGQRSAFPQVPIVAMSADWTIKPKALALGADAFLGKPMECKLLVNVLVQLLERGFREEVLDPPLRGLLEFA